MYFRLVLLLNNFLNCENYIFKMQAPESMIYLSEHRTYEVIDDKVRIYDI